MTFIILITYGYNSFSQEDILEATNDFGLEIGVSTIHKDFKSDFSLANSGNAHKHELDSVFSTWKGIDLNLTYLMKDIGGFVPEYSHFGVQILLPIKDSITYIDESSWQDIERKVLVKSSPMQINLKFGYELFSQDSEFFILYLGWGFGGRSNKLTYYCKDESEYEDMTSIYHVNTPNNGNNILVKKSWVMSALFHGGLFYEFEKFWIHGELGYNLKLVDDDLYIIRQNLFHGELGIFIPLVRH